MKAQLQKLAARYDVMQLRERWLVALAVLGGIVLIAYSFVIDPALKRSQLAERSATDQSAQLSSLQIQIRALQSPDNNPDIAANAELSSLKTKLGELAGRLEALESTLVPPQRMPMLLEDMIGRKSGLRLLSLKTLPVAPLLEKKANAEEKDAKATDNRVNSSAGLYKHGVEIKLEGSYQELAGYLQRLEKSGQKLLWSSVSLSAEKHPQLVLTLTVYTLSLDRAWLIV